MSETVVYWSSVNFSLTTPVVDSALIDLNNITKLMNPQGDLFDSVYAKFCPAVTGHLKNTFRLRSNLCYDITRSGDNFYSSQQDEGFWKTFVKIRDKNTGLVSFYFPMFIFFTEEDSLLMEFKHPIYANNSFSNNTQLVEGCYDIGKWFRNLDLVFFINSKDTKVDINFEDTLAYVKFLTDKKIKLKKFFMSDEIRSIRGEMLDLRGVIIDNANGNSYLKGLTKYYYTLKQSMYKGKIIKEIKNNLLES